MLELNRKSIKKPTISTNTKIEQDLKKLIGKQIKYRRRVHDWGVERYIDVLEGKKFFGLMDNWVTIAKLCPINNFWSIENQQYEKQLIEYFGDRILI